MGLYILLSVTLAVVFKFFQTQRKKKTLENLILSRKALMAAFQLLDEDEDGNVSVSQWYSLLRVMHQNQADAVIAIFHSLIGEDEGGTLDIIDFFEVADLLNMRLKRVTAGGLTCPSALRWLYEALVPQSTFQALVSFPWFNPAIVSLVAFCSMIVSLQETDVTTTQSMWLNVMFYTCMAVFLGESFIRALASPTKYWRQTGERIDLCAIILVTVGEIVSWSFDIADLHGILRPLISIRLVTRIERIRLFFSTIKKVAAQMISISTVLLLVNYCFAIIGMELFSGLLTSSPHAGFNFDNVGNAMLTLFQLMSMSSWADLIGAAGTALSPYVTWYFIAYNVVIVIIVVNLLVALFLEGFTDKVNTGGKRKEVIIAFDNEREGEGEKDVYKIEVDEWDKDAQEAAEAEMAELGRETGLDLVNRKKEKEKGGSMSLHQLHLAVNQQRRRSDASSRHPEISDDGSVAGGGGVAAGASTMHFLTSTDVDQMFDKTSKELVTHGPLASGLRGIRITVEFGVAAKEFFFVTLDHDAMNRSQTPGEEVFSFHDDAIHWDGAVTHRLSFPCTATVQDACHQFAEVLEKVTPGADFASSHILVLLVRGKETLLGDTALLSVCEHSAPPLATFVYRPKNKKRFRLASFRGSRLRSPSAPAVVENDSEESDHHRSFMKRWRKRSDSNRDSTVLDVNEVNLDVVPSSSLSDVNEESSDLDDTVDVPASRIEDDASLNTSIPRDSSFKPIDPDREAQDPAPPTDDKWTCSLCERRNGQTATSCLMCLTPHPIVVAQTESEPPLEKRAKWACAVCGRRNGASASACLLCLSPVTSLEPTIATNANNSDDEINDLLRVAAVSAQYTANEVEGLRGTLDEQTVHDSLSEDQAVAPRSSGAVLANATSKADSIPLCMLEEETAEDSARPAERAETTGRSSPQECSS